MAAPTPSYHGHTRSIVFDKIHRLSSAFSNLISWISLRKAHQDLALAGRRDAVVARRGSESALQRWIVEKRNALNGPKGLWSAKTTPL